MRASTIFAGFGSGAVLAGALAAPLYVGLPSRYLADWYYMTAEGSIWGFLGAVIVVVGAGALGGLLDPESPIVSGAVTGTVTALVGGLLMVLPATSLEAVSELITLADGGGEGRIDEMAAKVMVTAAWLPSTIGALLLAAGPAFGAMGGVGYDLARNRGAGAGSNAVRWSPVPMVALLTTVLWAAVQMVGVRQVQAAHQAVELPLSSTDALKLSVPAAMLGVFVVPLLAWALRDAVVLYRGGRRLRGASWAAGALGLSLVVLAEGLLLVPSNLTSPVVWTVAGVGVVAVLVVLFRTARSDVYLSQEGGTVFDVLAHGLLLAILALGPALYAGGSAAIAVGTVVLPWVGVADGAQVPAASELLVSRVFQIHWVAGIGVGILGLIWMIVAIPFWWFGRRVRRR